MNGLFYAFIGVLAIIIHIIVNISFFFKPDERQEVKAYKRFLLAVLFYFIADCIWGFLQPGGSHTALYIDTVMFFITVALTVEQATQYAAAFLHIEGRMGRFVRNSGIFFCICVVVALVINFFVPIYFWFDDQRIYHTGIARNICFGLQVALLVLVTFVAISTITKTQGVARNRNVSILGFCIAMSLALIAQNKFPQLPLYTVGMLLGTLIIYVFIHQEEVSVKLEENKQLNTQLSANNQQLVSLNTQITDQYNVISSLTRRYLCIYHVDLTTGCFYELTPTASFIHEVIGDRGDARQSFRDMCEQLVPANDQQLVSDFINLDTLVDRLRDTDYLEIEFNGRANLWNAGSFVVVARNAQGDCTQVLWCVRSIHERKQREENFRRELHKLKSMLEASGLGTWQLIKRKGIHPQLIVDDTMKGLMGIPPEDNLTPEEVNEMLESRIHPDDIPAFAVYDEQLLQGQTAEITYRWYHPTLGLRYIRCGGGSVRLSDGFVSSGYHRDVTDMVLQEKELEFNIAANQAKTRFLQNMSHEIRTPLNAMFGFAQLLGMPDGTWSEEEKLQYNDHIYNSFNMLDMLISDILDSADSENGNYRIELSDFTLNSVCRNALMTVEFRRPAAVQFLFTSDFADDYQIHSDGRRIQQVLINYLTNACKFTRKGSIHLHCSATENPGKLTLSVTDTGVGVPIEKSEEIFGRFTKLDEHVQGSGLGLNICHTIATKLGGEVYLDTTYTGGARFVFVVDGK